MLRTSTISRPTKLEDLLSSKEISRLDPLDLASRRVFFGKLKGERRSKKRGHSVEFADHRPYVSGDDLRHIDWNIFGRLDKLFLKLFLEEEDLSLHVVLDASASSDCGEPNKFHFMQRCAMALGYVGLVNLNRVAATVMSGVDADAPDEKPKSDGRTSPTVSPVRALRDLRGRRRVHDLARFLCSVRPGGVLNFRTAAERIALSRRGKGVMVIFSDFFFKDGYEDGLRLLAGHGYDLILVQVLSPQELEPPIKGDLRLKDIEDSDTAEVTISAPLLKRYQANLAAYCQKLREFALRRDMALLTVKSDTPVDSLVADQLRRLGVLK
ncbi:MAG: DUF58 domain-containing protein [Phycisphaeraceae bacterium]|nr:DUF58 domain-containing protein [Phycisphaeraceae bacterium]